MRDLPSISYSASVSAAPEWNHQFAQKGALANLAMDERRARQVVLDVKPDGVDGDLCRVKILRCLRTIEQLVKQAQKIFARPGVSDFESPFIRALSCASRQVGAAVRVDIRGCAAGARALGVCGGGQSANQKLRLYPPSAWMILAKAGLDKFLVRMSSCRSTLSAASRTAVSREEMCTVEVCMASACKGQSKSHDRFDPPRRFRARFSDSKPSQPDGHILCSEDAEPSYVCGKPGDGCSGTLGWWPCQVALAKLGQPRRGLARWLLGGHPRKFCRGKDEINRASRVRRSAAFCCCVPRWRNGNEQAMQRTTDRHRLCRNPREFGRFGCEMRASAIAVLRDAPGLVHLEAGSLHGRRRGKSMGILSVDLRQGYGGRPVQTGDLPSQRQVLQGQKREELRSGQRHRMHACRAIQEEATWSARAHAQFSQSHAIPARRCIRSTTSCAADRKPTSWSR